MAGRLILGYRIYSCCLSLYHKLSTLGPPSELYIVEELCNLPNGLASTMEFTLLCMVDDQCPLPFPAIFTDLPGITVTEDPGE